jgi:AraC-like DNA-binding protein
VLALLGSDGGVGRFADIAAAGGYYDQPHLNRDFRELAGCTPGEYLARMLPGGRGVAG